jgi:hypothetical protein
MHLWLAILIIYFMETLTLKERSPADMLREVFIALQ